MLAPVAPGVTDAGVKVALAPGGRFDVLNVTALVKGVFTELTTMVYAAKAPGGINWLLVGALTAKSVVLGVTSWESAVELDEVKLRSPL